MASRVKVSADGHGVVSHAGMALVRELADRSGLSAQVTAALADTYRGPWVYALGEVFADLAAAVADGADCIDAVGQLCGDREHVLGAKASTTTMWRLVDERIDAAHLPGVRGARAAARTAAWAAGAAAVPGGWLHVDIDATLVIDHSDNKELATPTWKKSFGHHPLLAFLDRPEIAGGEALAGLLGTGRAGSNTAADHITVLYQALAALPAAWRTVETHRSPPDLQMWLYAASVHPLAATHVLLQPEAFGPESASIPSSQTRGDPVSPLRGTNASTHRRADTLTAQGIRRRRPPRQRCSATAGLWPNSAKTIEGRYHIDSDVQFRYINERRASMTFNSGRLTVCRIKFGAVRGTRYRRHGRVARRRPVAKRPQVSLNRLVDSAQGCPCLREQRRALGVAGAVKLTAVALYDRSDDALGSVNVVRQVGLPEDADWVVGAVYGVGDVTRVQAGPSGADDSVWIGGAR